MIGQLLNEFHILQRFAAGNLERAANLPTIANHKQGGRVILDIDPIACLLTVPIDRQIFPSQGFPNHQQN